MTGPVAEKIWWQAIFAEQQAPQAWLRQLQQAEKNSFLERGLPTRHEERWKYSDTSFLKKQHYQLSTLSNENQCKEFVAAKHAALAESILLVFVNGHFSAVLSDLSRLPDEVVLCSMREALSMHPERVKKYLQPSTHALTNLNTALLTDGVFLEIPQNCVIKTPLHILHLHADEESVVNCPRNLFILGKHSEVIILEEHCASVTKNYLTNTVTDVHTDENAQFRYFKIQNDSDNATHFSQLTVQQKKDSAIQIFHLALGAKFAREDVSVNLNETGSGACVNGFYHLHNDDQHIDHHIQIDHKAVHTSSNMLYKGILDKKSHGVFNGKILVHADAQKTYSEQANHNLLLSKNAVIDTKPELEIYADDVKCSHGTTVGQLDNEALFYLRARGVALRDALKLLTAAFADEALGRVSDPAIFHYMNVILNEKLAHENK